MATVAQVDEDRGLITEALWRIRRPKGIGEPRLEFGADHAGHDAVYLWFSVGPVPKLTDARVEELVSFSNCITDSLYQLGTENLFYVRFEDEL